jgi:hypothetical protein
LLPGGFGHALGLTRPLFLLLEFSVALRERLL